MSINRLIAIGLAASVLMAAATGCGKVADAGTTATADSGTTANNAGGTTAIDAGSTTPAGAASTTANNAGSTTPNTPGSVTSSETPIEEPSPSPGKEELTILRMKQVIPPLTPKKKQLQSPPSQIVKKVNRIPSMSTRTSA